MGYRREKELEFDEESIYPILRHGGKRYEIRVPSRYPRKVEFKRLASFSFSVSTMLWLNKFFFVDESVSFRLILMKLIHAKIYSTSESELIKISVEL